MWKVTYFQIMDNGEKKEYLVAILNSEKAARAFKESYQKYCPFRLNEPKPLPEDNDETRTGVPDSERGTKH